MRAFMLVLGLASVGGSMLPTIETRLTTLETTIKACCTDTTETWAQYYQEEKMLREVVTLRKQISDLEKRIATLEGK